ncbi:class I mannose-6-phosphate isomerase [Alicyclobacillus tolerans]|uniref:type I phosphomannose isomerase catalytic subunit n=1 Tax=Alicyclobacillus tolerans TaxID=90970 RepID=UPI001F26B2D2|nr:type I phosphomannose isomerase catalytic subunit [Alicyclobacillus tolerans]MCF8566808.1 class I mannose-6-phosphate isomerase [Alicyclobacillus tolerans]
MQGMQYYPVKFKPIPTPRMWGGHTMKSWFGVDDITVPVGEYWLVSAHPTATSVVENGIFAGMTLTELTRRHPEAYLGSSSQPRFPLLIKLIEAGADLSVQVHPDDDYAREHEGDFGKTEAWYVLDAPPGGQVVYGHQFKSRDDYFTAVQQGRVKEALAYRQIKKGDLVYVPAKTLHAILAHTTVIEVQQTSDVTYRVYDWDRVDKDGHSRQLHVDKAADVLDYKASGTQLSSPSTLLSNEAGVVCEQLLKCPYFTMDRVQMAPGHSYCVAPVAGPSIVIGVSGTGSLAWERDRFETVRTGDAWLLPSSSSPGVQSEDDFTFLRITY